ncbi:MULTISPECIES: hypothetical protein [Xanthomonas]|uniref:hypothetical protein n=1 Tax=Xanthomonas TaxID=338 RepID=UPI00225DFAB7|nr:MULTISPECIES: hypothetical protein [Xanthomonas]MCW0462062.1 hypothetical protein [Xanthomonas sacchari]MDY4340024.1 hypothetical protein [Xanthomonas sp. LF07-6]
MRRPSTTGLAFCVLYLATMACCQWLASNPHFDGHVRSLVKILPFLPILLPLATIGLMPLLDRLPQAVVPLLLLLCMLWGSYWLGRFLERWIGAKLASRKAESLRKHQDR